MSTGLVRDSISYCTQRWRSDVGNVDSMSDWIRL